MKQRRPMLLEKLLAFDITPPPSNYVDMRRWAAEIEEYRTKIPLRDITVLDASELVRVFFEQDERERFNAAVDFPGCVCPWDRVWIEGYCPRFTYSKELGKREWPRTAGTAWGVLVETTDCSDDRGRLERWAKDYQFPNPIPSTATRVSYGISFIEIYEPKIGKIFFGPMMNNVWFQDEQGTVLLIDDVQGRPGYCWATTQVGGTWINDFLPAMNSIQFWLWYTFTVANCRNVLTVEHEPNMLRQEIRMRERKGLPPVRKHYTLEIKPSKAAASRKGTGTPGKALHLCRGHFSHYSEDKPLFGKYSGTFWIPPHMRGNAEFGEVTKDYRVGKEKSAEFVK